MELPCYKCGQTVEEGQVFCPHCRAPQIRVVVEEAIPAAATAGSLTGEDADIPSSQSVPVLAVPTTWSKAVKACGLAALVSSVLTFLGLHPLVAMPSAGFLAVVFYRQGQRSMSPRPGAALRLGAFGGLLYFGIVALLTSVAAIFPQSRAELHQQIVVSAQKFAATHADSPELQQVIKNLNTPETFAAMLVAGGMTLLILSLLLGGVGGILGGVIFGRRPRD